MANAYSVDKHPKKNAIIRELINQVPYDKIANNYGLTFSSVQRYATGKLRMSAAKALAKGHYNGEALLARIEDTIVYVQKMYEACDDWLRDPEDPARYTLAARAEEVKVVYEVDEYDGDKLKIKRYTDTLQNLLDRSLNPGESPVTLSSKQMDNRQLLLNTAQTLNKQLETLAKIAGVVQEVTQVDVNVNVNTQLVSNVIQIIEREVDDPELVQRIVEGISNDA